MNLPVLVGSLLLVTGTQVPLQVKQDHVLPVFGCGTGCRVETEQLTYPETMDDGWIRIKVIQKMSIYVPDKNGVLKKQHCRSVEDKCSPEKVVWLFANCSKELFAWGPNADRTQVWEEDVFHRQGGLVSTPKHQSIDWNPFMRCAKLCPAEAKEGLEWIHNGAY